MKKEISVEIVRDFDNTYYANIYIDGAYIFGLPENVDYRQLQNAVNARCPVRLPPVKDLRFQRLGRKEYARVM